MVTETYPPEVNGVAITIGRMVDGLLQRRHQIHLIRPRQSTQDVALQKDSYEETLVAGMPAVTAGSYAGRYIHYGVREHGMAAAMNGIALHGGFIPYGRTFLVFTDYCRPSIRLAALSHLRPIYVFTHDSIGLGEDGPTHQPIEQAASLRLIPNMEVWRPCDTVETAVAWGAALARKGGPTALLLSRTDTEHPECSAITFILASDRLVTLRYADPQSFRTFATRIQARPGQYLTGEAAPWGFSTPSSTARPTPSAPPTRTAPKTPPTPRNPPTRPPTPPNR